MATVVGAPTLADRIRDGDTRAEEEFVACYYGRVLLLARVRLRDEQAALDLTQEAIFGALQGIRDGRLHCSNQLSSYVYGTSRNLFNNRYRRGDPPTRAVPGQLPGGIRPDQFALERERHELVRQALEGFNPVDRAILGMMLVEGKRAAQIAVRLRVNREVVRRRRTRAVRRLTNIVRRASRRMRKDHRLAGANG